MKKIFFISEIITFFIIVVFIVVQTSAEDLNTLGFSPAVIDVDIGSSFSLSIYANIVQESDTVEATNFSWTAPGIVNYSFCDKGELFQDLSIYYDPDAVGEYNNSEGWAAPITQSGLPPINLTNGTLGIITWNAVGTGIAYVQIDLGKTIRAGNSLPTDYAHTAQFRVHPKSPELFIASQESPGHVNLSWEKVVVPHIPS